MHRGREQAAHRAVGGILLEPRSRLAPGLLVAARALLRQEPLSQQHARGRLLEGRGVVAGRGLRVAAGHRDVAAQHRARRGVGQVPVQPVGDREGRVGAVRRDLELAQRRARQMIVGRQLQRALQRTPRGIGAPAGALREREMEVRRRRVGLRESQVPERALGILRLSRCELAAAVQQCHGRRVRRPLVGLAGHREGRGRVAPAQVVAPEHEPRAHGRRIVAARLLQQLQGLPGVAGVALDPGQPHQRDDLGRLVLQHVLESAACRLGVALDQGQPREVEPGRAGVRLSGSSAERPSAACPGGCANTTRPG